MVFSFICPKCGAQADMPTRKLPLCRGSEESPHPSEMCRRDWRAEGVGIGPGVRESNVELSPSGYRDLFLPTEDDLSSADDPTGQKAMKEWMDEHEPKEGNKHPILPERTKTQFFV